MQLFRPSERTLQIRKGKAFFRKLEVFDKAYSRVQLVGNQQYHSETALSAIILAKEISTGYSSLTLKDMDTRRDSLADMVQKRAVRRASRLFLFAFAISLVGGLLAVLKEEFKPIAKFFLGASLFSVIVAVLRPSLSWKPKPAEYYLGVISKAVDLWENPLPEETKKAALRALPEETKKAALRAIGIK